MSLHRLAAAALAAAIVAAACATTPPTPEEQLAQQAYYRVQPSSYGALRNEPGDRVCEFSQSLMGTQNNRPRGLRRLEHLADPNISTEQLNHHFRALVGSTMHNGWMSGGAVVALIERTDNRVVFWRVVTEIPFSQVEAAAQQYCEMRDGRRARLSGQSFSCSQVYQPIRGQIIQGQDLDMRMQQTYAISAFSCS